MNRKVYQSWQADKSKRWVYLRDITKTKKVQPVKLPAFKTAKGKTIRMALQGWAPDGKWFLTNAGSRLFLVKTDGSATRLLTIPKQPFLSGSCRFSPDGGKLLFVTINKNRSHSLWVADVAGGKTKKVAEGNNFSSLRACWSPDGRRIAYSVMFINDKGKYTGESNLNVIDANGGNSVTIHREQRQPGVISIQLADWR